MYMRFTAVTRMTHAQFSRYFCKTKQNNVEFVTLNAELKELFENKLFTLGIRSNAGCNCQLAVLLASSPSYASAASFRPLV